MSKRKRKLINVSDEDEDFMQNETSLDSLRPTKSKIRKHHRWLNSLKTTLGKKPSSSSCSDNAPPSQNSYNNFELPFPSSSLQWVDQYAPVTVEDLCVHKKKIADVKEWLQTNIRLLESEESSLAQIILIISGPAGCGKSETIRVLASELGFELCCWEEPSSRSIVNNFQEMRLHISRNEGILLPYESKLNQFSDFLLRAGKYPRLPIGIRSASSGHISPPSSHVRKLVVVEELLFLGKKSFHSSIKGVIRDMLFSWSRGTGFNGSLIVFIFTNSHENTNEVEKFFDSDILSHPKVHQISFNAVSQTGLRKAITRVIDGEQLASKVSKESIDSIARNSKGDIRSAIYSLELLHRHSSLSSQCPPRKRHKNSTTSNKFVQPSGKITSAASRDDMYSLFHSMGKILQGKVGTGTDITAEEVVERTGVEPFTFTDFIYQNYPFFLSQEIENEHLQFLTSAFSDADILRRGADARFGNPLAIPESYISTIACHAFLVTREVANLNIHRQWQSLYKPYDWSCHKIREKMKHQALHLFTTLFSTHPSFFSGYDVLFAEIFPFSSRLSPLSGKEFSRWTFEQQQFLSTINRYSPMRNWSHHPSVGRNNSSYSEVAEEKEEELSFLHNGCSEKQSMIITPPDTTISLELLNDEIEDI